MNEAFQMLFLFIWRSMKAKNAPGHKGWEAKCILETTASGLVLCFIYQSALSEGSDASYIWGAMSNVVSPLAACAQEALAFRFAPWGPLVPHLSFLHSHEGSRVCQCCDMSPRAGHGLYVTSACPNSISETQLNSEAPPSR